VTVVHESGLASDILATALYVMGYEAGLGWCDQNDVVAIFIVPGSEGSWRVLPSREANGSLVIRAIDSSFEIE
jgi:thiamine biosynthesis lipoprotein ApbE